MAPKFTCFVIVITLIVSFVKPDLNKFVWNNMKTFPAYMKTLDPFKSSLVTGNWRGENRNVTLETKMRGLKMSGHSSNVTTIAVRTLPNRLEFTVDFELFPSIFFSGNHTTTGQVGNKNIKGTGVWIIPVSKVLVRNVTIKFEALPSGYLNLTEREPGTIKLVSNNEPIYFEGITNSDVAAEQKQSVEISLVSGLSDYVDQSWMEGRLDYIRALYYMHWDLVLRNHTMEDIGRA